MKKQVGITSMYYNNRNFGGMLQCYAMSKAVRGLGYEPEHLAFNTVAPPQKPAEIKETLRFWLCRFSATRNLFDQFYYARKFMENRDFKRSKKFSRSIPHSKYLGTARALRKEGERFNAFVTGSDQVWNPLILSDGAAFAYGLHFAPSKARKISYAASIGSEKAAVGKENLFREILNGLDHISVREKTVQEFLQPLTDKPVTVVLDPTLLLDKQEWSNMAVGPQEKGPYLFSYFLEEKANRHDGQLKAIADTLGMPLRCIADELGRYPRPNKGDQQILDAGPKEFVGYIRDAEMVFTNSFHGLVFSVLLQKPFWAFKRNKDSDKGSMNARVTDFLADFGLEDRLLEDGEIPTKEKLTQPIDYGQVTKILKEKRAFSLEWLKNALSGI